MRPPRIAPFNGMARLGKLRQVAEQRKCPSQGPAERSARLKAELASHFPAAIAVEGWQRVVAS